MVHEKQIIFVYKCNNCLRHVKTRFHCIVCDDFDLCMQCYDRYGHPHKMKHLGLDSDRGSWSNDQNAANSVEFKKLSIQDAAQALVHASQCHDGNCKQRSCLMMKVAVAHYNVCKRKTNGKCFISKDLTSIYYYHDKHCTETKCHVPYCSSIGNKFKQRQIHTLELKNEAGELMTLVFSSSTQNVEPVPNASSSTSIVITTTLSATDIGMPSSHQSGIGIKSDIQTLPANVLQVVKQVQEETAKQQQSHVGYGKLHSGVGVPCENMPPPSVQRAMSRSGATQEQRQQRYSDEADQSIIDHDHNYCKVSSDY